MRRRIAGLLVPVVALVGVIASGTWLVTQERDAGWWSSASEGTAGSQGWGGMMGSASTLGGMMGGPGWLDGESGPVNGLAEAREQAERFADAITDELLVGEVMRFENHYYAELKDSEGANVTEVLVDPRTGGVRTEFGPATMWNTGLGMSSGASRSPQLTTDQARGAAERELPEGMTLGPAEAFPGYYTMHTLRDGQIQGMLSVHAVTGDVWYHAWHGRFVEMSEPE